MTKLEKILNILGREIAVKIEAEDREDTLRKLLEKLYEHGFFFRYSKETAYDDDEALISFISSFNGKIHIWIMEDKTLLWGDEAEDDDIVFPSETVMDLLEVDFQEKKGEVDFQEKRKMEMTMYYVDFFKDGRGFTKFFEEYAEALDYFQEKTRKGKAGKYTFRTENVLIAHRVIKEKEEE